MLPEPVSPELVLVDPELGRRERARLEERALLKALHEVAPLRRAVAGSELPEDELVAARRNWRAVAGATRQRLLPAALACSLFANGVLAAKLFTPSASESAAPVAIRIVPSAPATEAQSRPPTRATSDAPVTRFADDKANAERKLAALIISAPAQKLPQRFRDPVTGLVRNNVQVVCRRKRPGFLCAIRLPGDATNQGLYVRYRATASGRPVFTWYGDRRH